MSTDTLIRPDAETDQGTGQVAHIVRGKNKVTEAYITGKPVIALCGEEFIPTRDPHKFPPCPACIDELQRL